MGTRLELDQKLRDEFPEIQEHLYFQPPSNTRMKYPCIVYEREGDNLLHADNMAYRRKVRYAITVIDEDPDSTIPDHVGDFFHVRMNRHFVSDNLHHSVYSIYY